MTNRFVSVLCASLFVFAVSAGCNKDKKEDTTPTTTTEPTGEETGMEPGMEPGMEGENPCGTMENPCGEGEEMPPEDDTGDDM